ncbi:OB-fold-containig protein [Cyanobacterium aponinum UTEX 3222]|uniref:Inner membrane protein YqiJ N-terminal domain-containing protein n=3 Tax=Cyanobacterium aponinum TaxID=379064 RepID=K9Z876_CYAAP|nr:OB-fold-containig protein [Cyanobacterium aponinum]WRL43243.1 OB-fold-containig protein [Cyanobacterium aponinum UTEX 3222]AFZ54775.1 hypothetical protein Cyan10605_2702 [Cyanobacterium aponinum PCC 10605]MBD2392641.1 DUF1449 family protein [Cyanobacterium aponinum FACHB-4101]MTF38278.1 DUF1449 family protein [Cyanobacterium aponinum 0216]PHV64110.1 DUF1449 domain-containing protein [Cyanobacterium aponinum IPPAS B-1201]
MLFDIANLTYWIFLGIGVLLFLFVIISGGGEDQDLDTDVNFDSDIDVDTDVDFDADVDGDVDGDIDHNLKTDLDEGVEATIFSFLSWFGLGKCPLMILLAIDFSTWGVTGWFLNVLVGGLLNAIPTGFIGFLIFFLSFCFSVWVGRVLSVPIGKIFANAGENVEGDRLVGCSGEVTSSKVPYIVEGRIAQADILDSASNLVTVEICLPEWAQVIPSKGQEVLIIEKRQHCFLAIAKDSSDQDKWFNSIKN